MIPSFYEGLYFGKIKLVFFCVLFINYRSSLSFTVSRDSIYNFTYQESTASFKNDTLKLSTGKVERTLLWTAMGFRTIGLLDIENKFEWADLKSNHLSDWGNPLKESLKYRGFIKNVKFTVSNDEGFSSNHLLVSILIGYGDLFEIKYVSRLYPKASGIYTHLEIRKLKEDTELSYALDNTFKDYYGSTQLQKSIRSEYIPIDFSKPTDRMYWGYRNDPGHTVNTFSMLREEKFTGFPLFQAEWNDWASGMVVSKDNFSLTVIKQSSKTANNSGHETGQFFSSQNGLEVTGWGLKSEEITQDFRSTWPTWIIISSGNQPSRQLAIKSFDRSVFPIDLDRDAVTIIDTWGSDFRKDNPTKLFGRENSHFDVVSKEIVNASTLGIDIVRIDDGWQNGKTFTTNNWYPNKDMGYADDWRNLKELADAHNVGLGLWANIRMISKDELFKIQKDLEPKTWKFDFDVIHNWETFDQKMRLARNLVESSGFKTQIAWCPEYNDSRYGWYSKARSVGPMFFQNIQNNLPEHLIYVPYVSLRHHWNFSKYYNLNKLQCNIQNPALTNKNLSDAQFHDIGYATAISLAGAPVYFMLTQLLTDSQMAKTKELLEVYNAEKREMFSTFVFPLGNEPDNKSWTGFQLHNPEKNSGYFLIFRELHSSESSKELNVYFLDEKKYQITDLISGNQTSPSQGKGDIMEIEIPEVASFRFLRYKIVEN